MALLGLLLTLTAFAVHHKLSALPEADCGPTSLLMVCRHLRLPVSAPVVFAAFESPVQDTSFEDLRTAAVRLGLNAEGRQMTEPELTQANPIGILHMKDHHYVALLGRARGGFLVANPRKSSEAEVSVWPRAYLAANWDGRVLVVSPASPTVAERR
jgi:ABC-type bacteriocin/lantibiotic exporter with double-glycine peptidase domain